MEKDKLGLGVFLLMFVGIVVGLALFQPIAQSVGSATNTEAVVNQSIASIVNGTTQYITNYKSLSNVVIINGTGVAIIDSSYYTLTNNVVHNGALSVSILPNAPDNYTSAWKVSGTGQPLTYIADAGSRSMASLIVIFFALLIAAIAIGPAQEKLRDMFG